MSCFIFSGDIVRLLRNQLQRLWTLMLNLHQQSWDGYVKLIMNNAGTPNFVAETL